MATGSLDSHGFATSLRAATRTTARGDGSLAWQALRAAGSLKITVVMFLAGIFVLFVGTLAQDEKNLPEVKQEYFNSWIAQVPFSDFFPVTVFGPSTLTGWFPFPGGATIGLVLLVNLVAAKLTRFHVHATGTRLLAGTIVSLVGGLLTLLVILSGHYADGLQGRPPIDYATVWRLVQAAAVTLAGGLGWAAVAGRDVSRLTRIVLWVAAASAATVAAISLFGGEGWRMSEPGLRIMWQLIQSSVASLILLAGLIMVFGSRGGNVLIHLGVGLLMLGQFAFGDRQIEERMALIEGQSSSMALRTDETELAVIRAFDAADDQVTVISGRLLKARAGGDPIKPDGLPFDVRVLSFFPNSGVMRVGPVAPNQATTGIGRSWLATNKAPEGGASSKPNISSAYVTLVNRATGADLGTFLVSQYLNDQAQLFMGAGGDEVDTVEVDGTRYRLQLRYRREYKPYSVTLTDVRRINYSASETPRDYSSYVTFTDTATHAQQDGRIWMNNPVRYRGETFYQSQYSTVELPDGTRSEMTGLQVVENAGWLIPYVACVLALWGMLAHFGGTFLRFADRYDRGLTGPRDLEDLHADRAAHAVETSTVGGNAGASRNQRRAARRAGERLASAEGTVRRPATPVAQLLIPVLALSCVALFCLMATYDRSPRDDTRDWRSAAALPVLHEGRIKPLDTVARNTLQLLGNRTSVIMPKSGEAQAGVDAKVGAARPPADLPVGTVSAARWMLGMMAGAEWVEHAPVFRIDAQEVTDLFDLTRRKGHRYSHAELEAGLPRLRTQLESMRDVPPEQFSFTQKKFSEINQKLMAYDLLRYSYETPRLPDPGEGEEARKEMLGEMERVMQMARRIEASHPPAALPPKPMAGASSTRESDGQWQSLYPAWVSAIVGRLLAGRPGQPAFEVHPGLLPLTELLGAVTRTPADFNRALDAFKASTASLPEVRSTADKAAFEAWLNRFNPTDLAKWLYVLSGIICFSSFLVARRPLNRFVFWMLVGILLLHTFALGSRVYLTGRPPVVNLYSSAVFIGWACVLAGLALEGLHASGIGNLVAALSGGLTLMVAYGLDSGDTMHVLQAVLDTQFWLSTHVITVTLGYGATFLAGVLGIFSVVQRIAAGWTAATATEPQRLAARQSQDQLYRMTYGVVCFALFFSFIGTVLGGLWADDSWGRFWGWDPKENGALMIVLWNAAALHARWDRWLGPRGFALFAIGGNIITAWSWFGTNQLGIGLHSYGFTSGVLLLLAGFVASQLLVIAAGWALTRPDSDGASHRSRSGLV
jgi:ABC-type transport system involved in cytochrome c biogenesis permease subunit